MSPLRLLHVVPYFDQAWAYGGIPRAASAMCAGLARRGHAVTVCTTDACDDRVRAQPTAAAPGPVTVRMFPNVSNRLAYQAQFFTPLGARRWLRAAAPAFDLAHVHACHNVLSSIAAIELARAGVPYVLSPNGTAEPIERRLAAKRLFTATVGRRLLPGAARVLAASEAERDRLVRFGVEPTRIRVVPNPVGEAEYEHGHDGDRFRAQHGLGERPIVLFLGRMSPRKGVDVLVRAFPSIAARDAVLVLAGNDAGVATVVDTEAARAGVTQRVLRTGLLRGTSRLDALAAANVVVYPSQHEVFGLVAVEALLAGTPVVACDDDGCGEIVRSLDAGCVVPPGDAAALARAIDTILADPPGWRARAAAARPAALRRFGSATVAAQLEALYEELAAGRALPQERSA